MTVVFCVRLHCRRAVVLASYHCFQLDIVGLLSAERLQLIESALPVELTALLLPLMVGL